MSHLVSVIIPCYNCETWLCEAIDSALNQTYPSLEVIVIDDGSTDQSLDLIRSYENKIIWETGPNFGGNHARNRGLELSQGRYIQYLDSDDYLLPQKIEKQVSFLKSNNFDVVYGDWRHQYHLEDGRILLDDIKNSGVQTDIFESLLSGWWVSPACLLFKRSAVERAGRWDEELQAGQDRDFFLAVVFNGATVGYQAECDSIYRRYGNVTVSSSSKERYLDNHIRILQKYEALLASVNKLSKTYKEAIAQSYFTIARKYLTNDLERYTYFLEKVLELSPNFKAQSTERSTTYTSLQNLIGFRLLEYLTSRYIFLKSKLSLNFTRNTKV